jgi:hypothetical protein
MQIKLEIDTWDHTEGADNYPAIGRSSPPQTTARRAIPPICWCGRVRL